MSLNRVCFLCSVYLAALWQPCVGRAAGVAPKWHCDNPTLAPDGVRVAYLQWDSLVARIVVVNLDLPGRTAYINLGETGADPITLFWKTNLKLELRKGANTFAVVDADPQPATAAQNPIQSRLPLPSFDQSAIQTILQHKLPHRSIHLLNWDEARRRVLLLAIATNDPGRFFVYDRSDDLLFEVARRKSPNP